MNNRHRKSRREGEKRERVRRVYVNKYMNNTKIYYGTSMISVQVKIYFLEEGALVEV